MADGWQWFGLWTTVAGTLAGVAGLAASVVAARRAKSAADAATEAAAEARRTAAQIARTGRLTELGEDFVETQVLLRADVPTELVAARLHRLAGGVSRFPRRVRAGTADGHAGTGRAVREATPRDAGLPAWKIQRGRPIA